MGATLGSILKVDIIRKRGQQKDITRWNSLLSKAKGRRIQWQWHLYTQRDATCSIGATFNKSALVRGNLDVYAFERSSTMRTRPNACEVKQSNCRKSYQSHQLHQAYLFQLECHSWSKRVDSFVSSTEYASVKAFSFASKLDSLLDLPGTSGRGPNHQGNLPRRTSHYWQEITLYLSLHGNNFAIG